MTMLAKIISDAEESELTFHDAGIKARRKTGAFYTPFDAALLFWKGLLRAQGVALEKRALLAWLKRSEIIDPSCGSGIFLYALLSLLQEHGITTATFNTSARCQLVDINPRAVAFVKKQLKALGIGKAVCLHREDGIAFLKQHRSKRVPVIVGNPPYVRLQKGSKRRGAFGDLFAHFLFAGMQKAHSEQGAFGQIVPLSVTFSRHFVSLRKAFLENAGAYHFLNFDNMPDTLFSNGKPDHAPNQANSQRATMAYGVFDRASTSRFFSSPLLAWRVEERAALFSKPPEAHAVVPFGRHLIIPKPQQAAHFTRLTRLSLHGETIGSLVDGKGKYKVYISNTARNYISAGLAPYKKSGTMVLSFATAQHAAFVFSLLVSSAFLQHWKMLGDGFHVTKEDITSFPLHTDWLENEIAQIGQALWKQRQDYAKSKRNAGIVSHSFDFRPSPEVRDIDAQLNDIKARVSLAVAVRPSRRQARG